MFSSKIDKCSSPRPLTLKPSAPSNCSTFNPTLVSSSFSNLSFKCLLVKNLPLWPANGELLTKKFIDNVGSSITILGSGLILSFSQIVSPIETSEHPATVTISQK